MHYNAALQIMNDASIDYAKFTLLLFVTQECAVHKMLYGSKSLAEKNGRE